MGHDVSKVKESVAKVAKNDVAIVTDADGVKLVKYTFRYVVKLSLRALHDGCGGQIGRRLAQGSP